MLQNSLKKIASINNQKIASNLVPSDKTKSNKKLTLEDAQKRGLLKKQLTTKNVIAKITSLSFFKYVCFSVLFFVLNNVVMMGSLRPCFYGIFLSFLFLGENAFYLALSYLISVILSGVNLINLSFALVACVAGGLISYLHKHKFKSFKTYLMCIYAFLLGMVYVALNLSDTAETTTR